MRSSDTIKAVLGALTKAQGDLPGVPKNHEGQVGQRRYAFADLSDMIATIRPVLAKHGLGFSQNVSTGDGAVSVSTMVFHSSGEWFASDDLRLDGGNTAQTTGSAITYAKRYSLAAFFGIVGDDDDDGAAASAAPQREQRGRETANPIEKPQASPARQRPAPPPAKDTRDGDPPPAKAKDEGPTGEGDPISEGMRKKLFAVARDRAKAIGDESIGGSSIVKALLGEMEMESTKEIKRGGFDQLLKDVEAWEAPQ